MSAEPPGSSGPWLLKVNFSGFTGKHADPPLEVEDVVVLDLGRPPDEDPETESPTDGPHQVATAFITEYREPDDGLDVDLESFRLVHEERSWSVLARDPLPE